MARAIYIATAQQAELSRKIESRVSLDKTKEHERTA